LVNGFIDLETEMATKNVERVLSAISNDADSFDIFVHD